MNDDIGPDRIQPGPDRITIFQRNRFQGDAFEGSRTLARPGDDSARVSADEFPECPPAELAAGARDEDREARFAIHGQRLPIPLDSKTRNGRSAASGRKKLIRRRNSCR